MWPVKNSTSVPHTPARSTSTTTWPGAATGGSTPATAHWRGPVSTNARMPRPSGSGGGPGECRRCAGCCDPNVLVDRACPATEGRPCPVQLSSPEEPAASGGPVRSVSARTGSGWSPWTCRGTGTEWAATFAVNVNGTFHLCRAVVPGMRDRGWGRIVNLASMAGKDGNPRLGAYSATKAAVIGMTKSLGKELATSGVLVNAIAPAVIETPMNAANTPEVLEYMTSLIPMRRLGRPEEVAELVAWLASDKCSFSTGAGYDLSGGRATY